MNTTEKPIKKVKKRGVKISMDVDQAVAECLSNGWGYLKAKQYLIDLGFSDNFGECSISQRKFYLAAHRVKVFKKLYIDIDPNKYDLAMEHKSEIEKLVSEYLNKLS